MKTHPAETEAMKKEYSGSPRRPFSTRKGVVIQVGAHKGDDDLIGACHARGNSLYLFEPVPHLFEALQEKTAGMETVRVVRSAASDYNGKATFHIANHDTCSSLSSFDSSVNQTWVDERHAYKSFEMVQDVEVDVTRLDTFLEKEGIATIDFLVVDAQGEDLKVIQSLGDRIVDVKRLQFEVLLFDKPLYAGQFSKREAVEWLEGKGFEIHYSNKQSLGREENITFRNKRFYPNVFARKWDSWNRRRLRRKNAFNLANEL